jgi:predicted O-linked N-acetylglucosamine transferase (SPINDLY family)
MLNFSMPNPDQLLAAAHAHHVAGRLAEAEKLYRQILSIAPNHADAAHLLGVLACQVRQFDAAIALMSQAVSLMPRHPVFRSNLGEACRQAGQLDRAEAELRQAVEIDPSMQDARTNLATVQMAREQWEEALATLAPVVRKAPGNAVAWRLSGDALTGLKRPVEAMEHYRRALALKPDFVDARFNLAALLADAGRFEEALPLFRSVIAAAPEDWEARLQLSDALLRMNRSKDAFSELAALVERNPSYAPGLSRIANLLRNGDQVDEALKAYARAVQLAPDDWITRCNMAFALRDQARLAESLALQREIVAAHPDAWAARSGLIFTLHLAPGIPREEIRSEQENWNRRHGDSVKAQRTSHGNSRDPRRRLRVGYVSSDLRSHPVGRFMLPLVRNHDRAQVEVFCYRGARAADGITAEFEQAADHFKSIAHLTDDDAAALIRADQIDILVDLNNHTIDNRMMLFARKPAPVQISYLAFCADTGVETIDWRLTDPFIDPPGTSDDRPFEKPLRLAETYWCYSPLLEAGDPAPAPARAAGHVTFGSFNYFSKVNDDVLALWARLLQRLPQARLMIHVPKGSRQDHVRSVFAAQGIAADRLTLFGRLSERDYFRQYGQIDVALDTFPWAGGTTTCDALYMGVPVITLAGAPGAPLQRGGVSILSNIGMTDWIAHSPEEYLTKAENLSRDLNALVRHRETLRQRMRESVLMDGPRFARNLEAALRQAWAAWCLKGS